MVGFVKTVVAVTVGAMLATFITSAMPTKYTPVHLGARFGTFVARHTTHAE